MKSFSFKLTDSEAFLLDRLAKIYKQPKYRTLISMIIKETKATLGEVETPEELNLILELLDKVEEKREQLNSEVDAVKAERLKAMHKARKEQLKANPPLRYKKYLKKRNHEYYLRRKNNAKAKTISE